jgi:hypothetical protein
VREQFSEKELTELTCAVMTVNAWSRIHVAFRGLPGALDRAYGLDKSGLS